ncbi:hypothetical protein [Levilactobacillus lindianensis]|uniref:hypothetical protein n=1 Tax=Levilactobacillus lindianensis TaxID=2486018 RepID=UPI000F73EE3F|nr:hypothetical protein [Levilactobacillus lindianensis]
MKIRTLILTVLASTALGGSVTSSTNVPTAQAKKLTLSRIYKHYNREYKVKVRKTRHVAVVKYFKNGGGEYVAGHVTLHRGEVVRTWYRGAGGVNWQVTGGKHGKYNSGSKMYSANWTNSNQFKILHTYSASHAKF